MEEGLHGRHEDAMEDCRQQDAESRPLLRKGLGLEESKAFANVAVRPAHSVGNI